MATIKSSLVLSDRMSAVLNKINTAMGTVINSCETMQMATGQAVDVHQWDAARVAIGEAGTAIQEMETYYNSAAAGQDKLNKKIHDGTSEAGALLGKIKSVVGAYVGFAAIKKVVGDAIDYASDLQEVQNVVDVTFGASSATVDKWAKNTLYSFGLSELSAKQYAGTMGAMLKSSGLTGKSVDSMSMKLAELAGDMASFYNKETDEAFAKIRSGISGETEPLKQLGINLNVANLEAYALSQGIKKSYNSMSQAEQVMLRYNYLLSATNDAQGDFARTIDSYANQTKLLKENWKDFTGNLAQSSLPILASGVKVLNSGIRGLAENWNMIAPVAMGLVSIVGAYTAALAVNTVVQGASLLTTKLKEIADYRQAKATLKAAKAAGVDTVAIGTNASAKSASAAASAAAAAGFSAEAIATHNATVAQTGFNVALFSCPITYVVLGIILLAAGLGVLCNWFAKTQGISTDCFGAIVGGAYVAWEAIKNAGLWVANVFLGLSSAGEALMYNIDVAFYNGLANVQAYFYDMAAGALNAIGRIAEGLNALPFVSIDYQGLYDKASAFTAKAVDARANKSEYKDVSAAFESGYNTHTVFTEGWAKDAFTQGATKYNEWKAAKGADNNWDEVAGNTASIASSAGSIAASLDKTNEELEWIRDIAEREVINRFTTAEVKVDFTGMTNQISNDMDLDGVISGFVGKFKESLETAAQGVY